MPTPLKLTLIPLDGTFAICKLPSDAPMPAWASSGPFVSITRTGEELSLVCRQNAVPSRVQHEGGWRALRIAGQFPFETTGVVASLVGPLADAGISVFVISTFDTDYLLLKEAAYQQAINVLREAGHEIAYRSQSTS